MLGVCGAKVYARGGSEGVCADLHLTLRGRGVLPVSPCGRGACSVSHISLRGVLPISPCGAGACSVSHISLRGVLRISLCVAGACAKSDEGKGAHTWRPTMELLSPPPGFMCRFLSLVSLSRVEVPAPSLVNKSVESSQVKRRERE